MPHVLIAAGFLIMLVSGFTAATYEPSWFDPGDPLGCRCSAAEASAVDVRVDDVGAAEQQALALGAKRLEGGGGNFRVLADPVGHPLCLVAF